MKIKSTKLKMLIRNLINESFVSSVSESRFSYNEDDIVGAVRGAIPVIQKNNYHAMIVSAHNEFNPDESVIEIGGLIIDHLEAEDDFITIMSNMVRTQTSFGPGQINRYGVLDAIERHHDALQSFVKNKAGSMLLSAGKRYFKDKSDRSAIKDIQEALPNISDELSIALSVAFLSVPKRDIRWYIAGSSGKLKEERTKRLSLFTKMYGTVFVDGETSWLDKFNEYSIDMSAAKYAIEYFNGPPI